MGTEYSNVLLRKSATDLSCEVGGTKRPMQLTLSWPQCKLSSGETPGKHVEGQQQHFLSSESQTRKPGYF